MKNKSIGKVQSKRCKKEEDEKMKHYINFLDFLIILFGILGWCFLACFIWVGYFAYLQGDNYGMIRWNFHNEIILEFILINGIIIIMSVYLFLKVFGINKKKKRR